MLKHIYSLSLTPPLLKPVRGANGAKAKHPPMYTYIYPRITR